MKKVEIFGDSILRGVQVNPNNMRYHVNNNIDLELIGKKYELDINNRSKFGCTVTKGYSLLERYLRDDHLCDTILMGYGGNDCDFDWKAISKNPDDEHLPNTPINIFIDTYNRIIELLNKKGILLILTNLTPLEPQRFFDWFCNGLDKENILKWLGTINTIYRFQEYYSSIIEKIAIKTNTRLIDLRGAFLKHRRIDSFLCEDGTHPSTQGQKIITEAFLCFAEKLQ